MAMTMNMTMTMTMTMVTAMTMTRRVERRKAERSPVERFHDKVG